MENFNFIARLSFFRRQQLLPYIVKWRGLTKIVLRNFTVYYLLAFKEILPLVIQFVLVRSEKVLSKLATRLTIYAYASNSRYIML